MDLHEQSLLKSIKENDIKSIYHCLSKGANPNKIYSTGRTALGIAAQQGDLSMFKILAESQKKSLARLSDVSSHTEKHTTNLNLDLTVNNKRVNKNIGYFIIHKEMESEELGEGPTPDGMEALEWDMEIEIGNEEEVMSSTPPEAKIYKWYADILNRSAIVLQSPENDIARFDRFGLNALHYAIIEGHCNIVEYLLDNFTEVNVNQCDGDMFSPLQIAVHNGYRRMVNLLLDRGADVNFTNKLKHTPLHLACQKGYIDIVKLLVERGADTNIYDLDDTNPLSHAIAHNHEETATFLIGNGTRLNVEDLNGMTVLHRAVLGNLTGVVKKLLCYGARIIQSNYLLHAAIRHQNLEMVKALLNAGALINIKDEVGQTPLMCSCGHRNYEITKYLLENGASINIRNDLSGLTALHVCADSLRNIETFQKFLDLLLNHGADINAGSYMGTVLCYAIIVGNTSAACMLVRCGADVNAREERGFLDNLTLAIKNGKIELVKLIVYAGFNFDNLLIGTNRLKTENDDPLYDFLVHTSTRPLDLRDLCRIRIRKLLGKNLKKMFELPLPFVILNYLALEEL